MFLALQIFQKNGIDHKLLLIVLLHSLLCQVITTTQEEQAAFSAHTCRSAANLPLATLRSHHSRDEEKLIS